MQDVHRLGCRALAVDPLNRFLVTGGADCLVKLWEISQVSCARAACLLLSTLPEHAAHLPCGVLDGGPRMQYKPGKSPKDAISNRCHILGQGIGLCMAG